MSRLRVPGRRWCKDLTTRQLAALLFLADCPGGQRSWLRDFHRWPRDFHRSTLRSLQSRGLLVFFNRMDDDRLRYTVRLKSAGRALVAAYRYGYDAGLEAE